MLFNSTEFVFFWVIVFGLYSVLQGHWKLRKILLLLGSYWFYMAWNPPFVLILMASTGLEAWGL